MAVIAVTAISFISIVGVVLRPGVGKVMEIFPKVGKVYPPQAYHTAFTLCLLGIAIAIAFYGFSKDTRPYSSSNIGRRES